MHILQGVVLCCVLDTKCLCKAIAKVMAGTGLQRFTIMHQSLDGIGSFCTCEFFLLCFLSADNRHCQHFFTEISIQVQHLYGSLLCFFCGSMGSMSFLP